MVGLLPIREGSHPWILIEMRLHSPPLEGLFWWRSCCGSGKLKIREAEGGRTLSPGLG